MIDWPRWTARLVKEGSLVTDDFLLEAFERTNPPLLQENEAQTVKAVLGRKRGRRPMKGVPSLTWLSRKIAKLDRPDLPAEFLTVLADRLVSSGVVRDPAISIKAHRARQTEKRNSFARQIYQEIYALLEGNPSSVTHHILGELEVPTELRPRSTQALQMTWNVLNARLRMDAPSLETLRNLVRRIH